MASENQKAKVKQATELLEQGVEGIFTSGKMAEYLTVMSRFHSYSARNCMLILMQNPEATHVAGYKAWQQKFHRQVRKGERSITILAPISHKTTIRETNKDIGEVIDHEHVWMSFKAVPVFDIAQTDGEELPDIATDLTGDVKTKTYNTNYGIITVEECTRKEFIEYASEIVDYFEFADSLGIATDQTLSIDYHDGKSLYCGDYYGIEGSFRKSGIAFGFIDNGSTYMVTGKYTIDSNGVPERA